MGTKYKRVLLKISGEALLGNQQFGIDYEPVEMIANEIIIMNHGKFLCTLDDEENVEDAYLKWIGDKKI